jgi:hypothetical protein
MSPEMLETVDLRAWVDATGPEWWDEQQVKRVPSKMQVGWASGKLGYGRHEVPMEGDTVMHMAMSMHSRKRVAILSAKRKRTTSEDLKNRTQPGVKDFYHQAYDIEALEPVGVPVPLPFTSGDAPIGVWVGPDSYVVYADAERRRVCIVHMYRMPPPEAG